MGTTSPLPPVTDADLKAGDYHSDHHDFTDACAAHFATEDARLRALSPSPTLPLTGAQPAVRPEMSHPGFVVTPSVWEDFFPDSVSIHSSSEDDDDWSEDSSDSTVYVYPSSDDDSDDGVDPIENVPDNSDDDSIDDTEHTASFLKPISAPLHYGLNGWTSRPSRLSAPQQAIQSILTQPERRGLYRNNLRKQLRTARLAFLTWALSNDRSRANWAATTIAYSPNIIAYVLNKLVAPLYNEHGEWVFADEDKDPNKDYYAMLTATECYQDFELPNNSKYPLIRPKDTACIDPGCSDTDDSPADPVEESESDDDYDSPGDLVEDSESDDDHDPVVSQPDDPPVAVRPSPLPLNIGITELEVASLSAVSQTPLPDESAQQTWERIDRTIASRIQL